MLYCLGFRRQPGRQVLKKCQDSRHLAVRRRALIQDVKHSRQVCQGFINGQRPNVTRCGPEQPDEVSAGGGVVVTRDNIVNLDSVAAKHG